LNLSACTSIADDTLKALCTHNKQLETLNLMDCNITDVGLQYFVSGLPHLTDLKLAHKDSYKKITDKGLAAIGAGCPSLEEIHISRCKEVKDGGLNIYRKTNQ
jgi:hypothetical protein